MKILVTGGAGFIGSHLVKALLRNHSVRVLDDLSTGKKENVPADVEFIKGDVRDGADVSRAARGCEAVFHLAALTDARETGDKIFEVNFLGSRNVFAAAALNNARVIFASSAAVYGDGKPIESGEVKPISDYGKSKAKAEKLVKSGFIARLFNVYGSGGKGVINKFAMNIKQGEEIRIYGTGLQTRDYIYVDDVVSALMLGLTQEGTYNVGTGIETSLLNVVSEIEEACDSKAAIKSELPKEEEIKRSRADITKIRALGWAPRVSLEDGIRTLINVTTIK